MYSDDTNVDQATIFQMKTREELLLDRKVVLRPGFGPGSAAREAVILNRTILPEHWTSILFLTSLAVNRDLIFVAVADVFKACLD